MAILKRIATSYDDLSRALKQLLERYDNIKIRKYDKEVFEVSAWRSPSAKRA